MSARTSGELVEGYVARLRAELAFLGATEADDLVAEIRSVLIEAAGDDPERAASEIAKIGEPADLAAGILTEKGLSPADGMSTAEWWRMGVAVPLDIVVGLAVPAAMVPTAYIVATLAEPHFWVVLLGIAVSSASVSWYVWRPWRTGGSRRTAGMVLTGLAVVRAPGFRRVVRSRELAALGMRPPVKGALFGMVTLAVAILVLVMFGTGTYQTAVNPLPSVVVDRTAAVFETAARGEGEQRQQVEQRLAQMYDSLVAFGVDEAGDRYVVGQTLAMYQSLVRRAQKEKISSYSIGKPTKVSVGAWKVAVTEKTARGTHVVDFVLTLRLEFRPTDTVTRFDYAPDWIIYEISGEGLVAAP